MSKRLFFWVRFRAPQGRTLKQSNLSYQCPIIACLLLRSKWRYPTLGVRAIEDSKNFLSSCTEELNIDIIIHHHLTHDFGHIHSFAQPEQHVYALVLIRRIPYQC